MANENKNYIMILLESLRKKLAVLELISEENEKQKNMLSQGDVDLKQLEPTLEKKQEYIDQLNELDEGFQVLYDRVKEELSQYFYKYEQEILEMKRLISQITGKGMVIQTEEERNKQLIQEKCNKDRRTIRQKKTSKQVAVNYYKSMNKLVQIEPQFMDKKK